MAESTPPTDFGTRLRQVRDDRQLSQSELARLASLQPSAIAHFEANRRKPSFDNVRALARALRVSADYLLEAKTPVTAFRGEEKLSAKDIDFVQGIINMMIEKKK